VDQEKCYLKRTPDLLRPILVLLLGP